MPNVMVALPNIGGANAQRRKVWLTLTTWLPCSNAVMTRKPLKFAGVPQTGEPISDASGSSSPYCEDMWRTYCYLTSFSDCRYVPQLQRYSPTKLSDRAEMAIFGDFFGSCISSEPLQQVSDLRLKFALKPRHVWKYARHQSATAEIRRDK